MGEPSLWTCCRFAAFYQQVAVLGIKSMHSEWKGGDGGGLFILFGGRNRWNIKGPTAGSHEGMFPINHAVVMDGVWRELHAVSTGMISPARGSVRFILLKTQVLPQGSSGTGQFLDWTDGYAAGLSKQDVLLTACRFDSVMFSRSSSWQWVKVAT